MKWYQLDLEHIEQKLQVIASKGLTDKRVRQRLEQQGPNELISKQGTSRFVLFLKQFQDFMVLVLLAATLVAGLLGEYVDAIAIIVIVLINGVIGYFQEQRAEKSLDKLKELSAPTSQVLRDGQWGQISSQDLVYGDVVKLVSGDRVPADVRIIEASHLETEESTLTGESLPVAKHTTALADDQLDPQDQLNMGFMGTMVTRGSGIGIVVGTGMDTVMGQIATLMDTTEKAMTPLERKLAELGKILIVVALMLTAIVVLVGIYQGHQVYEMFLAGVSLAVAAIPEGLPAIVTVALSLGVQRMIRKKAIVRQLSSVETLGCASVICSDKTGTMTENKMTVQSMYLNNDMIHVTEDGYQTDDGFLKEGEHEDALRNMLLYGMLCNTASLRIQKGSYTVSGDPTDGALLIAARHFGLSHTLHEDYRVIEERPFDSQTKRMSVIIEDDNQRRFMITKGAPEVVLPRSAYQMTDSGRSLLKPNDQETIEQTVDTMADQALRTIAIGIKPIKRDQSLDDPFLEKDITFIGLYGLMDPPRQEVKEAVASSKQAGIKTVMITGDHKKTARAIAEEIGMIPEDGLVLTGSDLNQMSVDDLEAVIDRVYVFARVTPEHKLKIVEAFQAKGHVVAMTGDGVNDAPAIKASDIGISMGESGTDVTKEASSLILMDDNFATIKSAINEGRNIYENIRKFIRYLLASNVGEILVMLFAMMLALPLPLVPVQILWVNLITDGLPAMALGLDKAEENVMKRGPRNPRESVLSRGLGFKIITRGLLIGIVSLIAFVSVYQSHTANLVHAQTVAFTTLVLAQLIHVFDCRNETSIFSRNPFGNPYLILAVLSSVFLLLIVIYWQPLQPIFTTMTLGFSDWLLILPLSALPTVLFGFTKK